MIESIENAMAPSTVVQLEGIRRDYYKPDGSILVAALGGLDLTIQSGQYIAIMGASGSGKSTLMNIIGCLDRSTGGRFLLDGIDVTSLTDDALSAVRGQRIGFIFQAFNLISELDIVDNVAVGLLYQRVSRAERRERAIEALRMVGLDDRLTHRPKELSGGQQQRVAIARALATKPALILADEPTGNLDSATGKAILEVFDQLREQGLTLVVVTHDEELAQRAERIVRLKDGLLASDSLNEHTGATT